MNRPPELYESVEILNLFMLCEQMHCLPLPGGLFDQDAVVVHLFLIITALQREAQARDAKRG